MPSRDDIATTLAVVAGALPGGGEDRPGQLHMAQVVARAIGEGRHLVVQAGTGTGKSLAYLLPAVSSGRRVVVATATKALQDQLATKDLPFLQAQLGDDVPFTFALLKGRTNYICRQRVAEIAGRVTPAPDASSPDEHVPGRRRPAPPAAGVEPGGARRLFSALGDPVLGDPVLGDPDRDVDGGDPERAMAPAGLVDQVRRLVAWADVSDTGDRGDLDFEPEARAWSMVSVTARECPGAFRCPAGATCFAEAARARAGEADVVVVNTHLYATHVASDGAVLPEHDVVVFDEAHEVEDVMTAGLGIEVTPGRFRALALQARPVLGASEAGVAEGLADVADRLQRLLQSAAGRRVLTTHETDAGSHRVGRQPEPADGELAALLALGQGRVDALVQDLRRAEQGTADDARRSRVLQAAGHLTDDLHALAAIDTERVAWVEASGPGGRTVTLRLAPVEVGPVLGERLWPRVVGVLTSATVPPLVEASLGLPDETERIDVGSPFPYERNALLYCATALPDRRAPGAELAIHAELARLIAAAGGRTLALFTSWRAMRDAVDALRPTVGFPVLAQNDLPKARLVEAFAAQDAACLFATMSFWQGIDVPGATLSLVAIDRIPFPRPDDPLLDARRQRAGEGAFRTIDLPRAATLLA